MRISAILQKGRIYTRVRFADETIASIPKDQAVVGKDYISVKMLKGSPRYTQYEGEHIAARIEKGRVTIRNKDNICSATIARNQGSRGAPKVWCFFLMEVSKEISFAAAVDYFERHGITMLVSG
jgi:hypothetical protein